MSAKIPVAVYQIDLSQFRTENFKEITDKVISTANLQGGGYKEDELKEMNYPGYEVRLFAHCKTYQPKWSKFLEKKLGSNSMLKSCKNRTHAFVCFIGFERQVFAITGGGGSFALDKYISHNFGLEILVRLFEKDSKVIRAIKDRAVTGIVLGQIKYYRGDQKFTDENRFGKIFKEVNAELSEKILKKMFGFSDEDLTRKVSGCMAKSSFQINKAIDFDTLLALIKKFTEILKLKEKFALNKVNLISRRPQNALLLEELRKHLIQTIYEKHVADSGSDVDFCNKDFEKYRTASLFYIKLDNEETIEFNDPPEFAEVIAEMKRNGCCLDEDEVSFKCSVLERQLVTKDESGQELTRDSILDHLHGEMVHNGKTYFFVDGEWYLIHPEFIKDLNEECLDILKHACDETLIAESFHLRKREGVFNQKFIGKDGWLVFDTITPENIETCDILNHSQEYLHLIHVKKGFDNSVRDLASQVNVAAKRIRDDIKSGYSYIEELEKMTKKKCKTGKPWADQKIPAGGLKKLFSEKQNRQIVFCLAFVDTANELRRLKTEVHKFQSNIAKYSLIELYREINALGFGFKVVQLKKA